MARWSTRPHDDYLAGRRFSYSAATGGSGGPIVMNGRVIGLVVEDSAEAIDDARARRLRGIPSAKVIEHSTNSTGCRMDALP